MVGLPTERGSWFLEEWKEEEVSEVTPEEFSGLSRSIAIRNFRIPQSRILLVHYEAQLEFH